MRAALAAQLARQGAGDLSQAIGLSADAFFSEDLDSAAAKITIFLRQAAGQ